MKVGITCDLRTDYRAEGFSEEEVAEFDRESTLEDIESTLAALGFETDRIGHARALLGRLAKGDRWDLVFNICEGMYGIGREAQVPILLDLFGIPYTFSDPMVLSLTLHKAMTKRVVRDAGIPTPDFALVECPDDIAEIRLPYPLFVKPNAEGTGKGIQNASRAGSPAELLEVCLRLLEKYPEGVLVEEYLPGREFTVGILGTGRDARSAGVMEIVFLKPEAHDIYSYHTKSNYHDLVDYRVPEASLAEACSETALKAWRVLGCRDGGRIDLRADARGVPSFIEVNPLAGLDSVHSDLPLLCYRNGYSYVQIIDAIMQSALKRIRNSRL